MKLRATQEGLAIPAIVAAVLDKDTLVKITANRTVNKAGSAGDFPIGRLVVPAKEADGDGTVETRFKELIEIKGSGVIAAGDKLMMAAADGTTGENVVTKWTSGTDAVEKIVGVAWKGGADGATIEALMF